LATFAESLRPAGALQATAAVLNVDHALFLAVFHVLRVAFVDELNVDHADFTALFTAEAVVCWYADFNADALTL